MWFVGFLCCSKPPGGSQLERQTPLSGQAGFSSGFCSCFLAASFPQISLPESDFNFPSSCKAWTFAGSWSHCNSHSFCKLGVCSLPPLSHHGGQRRVWPSPCKGNSCIHFVPPFLCLLQPGILGYFEFNASPQPPGYLTFFASALHSLNKGQ